MPDLLNGYPERTLEECDHCGQQAELFHFEATGLAFCQGCVGSHTCNHCGNEFDSEESALNCCPSHECDFCGTEHRGTDAEDQAYDCCRHYCGECGSDYMGYDAETSAYRCCRYECSGCGDSYEYESDAASCCGSGYYGELPALPDIDIYDVMVPVVPGRPARLCSVEQELVEGASMVAKLLYEIGASSHDHVLGYHTGSSYGGEAHVEEDGSLPSGGGEVVYDRFNLSQRPHAERMSVCLTKIRQLRDIPSRPVKTGFAAGVHVHVSARAENGEMLTPRDVSALYELWCYAEDMLYSLSAAGWNRHRQPADSYSGYCKAVPKSADKSPKAVWGMMSRDRYFGLNFNRLFEATASCSCGAARMGDWPSCDCGAMDRATVEWRVFNSSTLPRTIHAWIVLAHAMTAHASRHEVGTLTDNPYGTQSPAEKREVFDRLMEVLPLSEAERRLLEETADRSPGL